MKTVIQGWTLIYPNSINFIIILFLCRGWFVEDLWVCFMWHFVCSQTVSLRWIWTVLITKYKFSGLPREMTKGKGLVSIFTWLSNKAAMGNQNHLPLNGLYWLLAWLHTSDDSIQIEHLCLHVKTCYNNPPVFKWVMNLDDCKSWNQKTEICLVMTGDVR